MLVQEFVPKNSLSIFKKKKTVTTQCAFIFILYCNHFYTVKYFKANLFEVIIR